MATDAQGIDDATDEALMMRVVQRDVRAFRVLVDRYRRAVMRSAFNVVRDAAEAEDIVQETFERVWLKAIDYRPRDGGSFLAWLLRIAINLSIDRKRRPSPLPLADDFDAPSGEPDSEQLLLGKEIGGRIAVALKELPERQRLAFTMCQINHMNNSDAAKNLGVTVGALELLLVRARKSVRMKLLDLVAVRA